MVFLLGTDCYIVCISLISYSRGAENKKEHGNNKK